MKETRHVARSSSSRSTTARRASKAEKTVTLTIDGKQVTVPEGTSIMRAAMEAGTEIPKLCATDMLEAFGSCRLCLVEIDGRAGTPASCTTPVAAGMVVRTQTERLEAHPQGRDGALHLRSSARLRSTCTANGDIASCRTWPARSACATCATAIDGDAPSQCPATTNRTRISPTTRRNASSARAACAPARRCRALSR